MANPSLLSARTPILLFASFALSLTPAAVAQHGGGGHAGGGGGFHGGGGGGGFHSAPSGGGFHGATSGGAPRAASRSGPGVAGVYRGGVAGAPANPRIQNPAAGSYNRYAYRNGGNTRNGNASTKGADGQWHAFGNSGTSNADPRPLNSAPGASTNSSVRSWTGQGQDVYETTTSGARAALGQSLVSRAHVLAGLKRARPGGLPLGGAKSSGFAAAPFVSSRPSSTLTRAMNPARIGVGPAAPTRLNLNSVPLHAIGNVSTAFRRGNFGNGFAFRGRGFGFGRGFGPAFPRFARWPWFRFGFFAPPFWYPLGLNSCVWGPNWWGAGFGYDPLWYGYTPCYGPWGWGPNNPAYDQVYPDDNYVYGGPYDDSTYPDNSDQPLASPDVNAPNDQSEPQADLPAGSDVIRANVQIYLKSGGRLSAIMYWTTGNKLSFVTDNGTAVTIQLDQLDLDRTVQENARRGVDFRLPEPPPSPSAEPNAAPLSSPAPKANI